MVCLRAMRWSAVALPGMPPACASVIFVTFFTLSFIILSYSFPALLARVMPLSFEHLPLVPLPLYSLVMLPCSQLLGRVSSWCTWLIACLSSSLVVGSASMNTSLGDDVIKWKHFPRYWPYVRGIHRTPVNSPHKGQWRGALMFSLICVWINDWVNNREAGDLRRYRVYYDVTVMRL